VSTGLLAEAVKRRTSGRRLDSYGARARGPIRNAKAGRTGRDFQAIECRTGLAFAWRSSLTSMLVPSTRANVAVGIA